MVWNRGVATINNAIVFVRTELPLLGGSSLETFLGTGVGIADL